MKAGEEEEGFEFSKFFPLFMWVVRDFILKLEIDGAACSENEYLDHALAIKPVKPGRGKKETMKFNEIKETLRTFFPKRRCFTLCKPVEDERITELEKVPDGELNPKFLQKADQFCSTVYKEGKVFQAGGEVINGPRKSVNWHYCLLLEGVHVHTLIEPHKSRYVK